MLFETSFFKPTAPGYELSPWDNEIDTSEKGKNNKIFHLYLLKIHNDLWTLKTSEYNELENIS